jgi:cold-inducible RNA-binding protein
VPGPWDIVRLIVNPVAAATQQGVTEVGKKLYVGNLAFAVTTKDLEELFAQAGVCESVAVITDRATGQSRGFGFVEMGSDADAQKAIQQFDGHELKGRALKVNEAREREGGGRGAGGGGGRGWSRRY